ncbi:MAG: M56 family metallopeptidase, partial [Oscillospiraceae bacterium]|nr:M56 family metallopeptidase [Oscillospiraceae bacterium]
MSAIFLKILNMSITASWLIMAVILARLFLKKAPKWIFCILWALVAIRLLCPLSLESALSLVPSAETVNTTHYAARPYIQSGIDVIDNVANDYLGSHYFEGVTVTPGDSPSNPINVISIIWIIGMTVMFLYALISYIRLKKSVGASVPVRDNILSCDEVKSPFILGIIKPLIYVPSSMTEPTLDYVITHETAHIKRHDHWWKPLGFLLLSVYWFNPLCWIAYILLCRDIEMACDEKVIRDMDKGNMAAYSQALLDCSFPKKRIAACPLAFGEVGVKERVRGVLNYKKPTFWIILIAVIACIGIAACLMTDPFSNKSLSEKLSVSMDMAVAEHNRSSKSEGHFAAADYDIMLVKQSGNETTVYAWVLYEEYSFDGKDVKLESGSHIPTAITFDTSDNSGDSSTYDLIEYWQPRDGSYYAEDIKAKFPWYIRRKAMD